MTTQICNLYFHHFRCVFKLKRRFLWFIETIWKQYQINNDIGVKNIIGNWQLSYSSIMAYLFIMLGVFFNEEINWCSFSLLFLRDCLKCWWKYLWFEVYFESFFSIPLFSTIAMIRNYWKLVILREKYESVILFACKYALLRML